MAYRWLRFLLAATLLGCGFCAQAQPPQQPQWLPDELVPWLEWVRFDHPEAPCSFLTGHKERNCVWPGELRLRVDAEGGHFTLPLTLQAQSWFTLPGSAEHWPLQVTVASGAANESPGSARPLPVVGDNGLPRVHLPAGTHSISGRFKWPEIPQQLAIPAQVVLLQVTGPPAPDAAAVRLPNERDAQGRLWLRKGAAQAERTPEQDVLNLQVFRLLRDGQPQTLTTEVQMQVAGQAREVQLGPLLPAGFTPRDLDSPLPARLEPNGLLRVQVRPGRFRLLLEAHSTTPLDRFALVEGQGAWPRQEIWAFQAVPELRTVQVSGAPVIDGSQTSLPGAWQNLPAYLVEPGVTLVLAEQYRGDPRPAENVLTLHKQLWLDFDGEWLTAKDRINGQMSRDWRLQVDPSYALGRVSLDGAGQLISMLPGSASAGVEVRQQELDLEAVSRLPRRTQLSISGWQQTFAGVSTTLSLPPGWAALHLTGADRVHGTWLSHWNLWSIFLLLVISVAAWRAISLPIGLLTLATLTLIFHRGGAPVLPWLFLAGGFALLPYARDRGRHWLHLYLAVSLLATTLVSLPFLVQQARSTIYPQLADSQGAAAPYSEVATRSEAPAMIAAGDAMLAESSLSRAQGKRVAEPYRVQYDPEQKIQVGPGLPEWQWRTLAAHWSGPVLVDETFELYLVGPWLTRLGHLLSVLLVAALLGSIGLHFARQRPLQSSSFGRGASAALVAMLAMSADEQSHAAVEVDADLLQTLAARLTAPPVCLPDCAAIEQLDVRVDTQTLTLELVVTNQSAVGVPLPGSVNGWLPDDFRVNGEPGAVLRGPHGQFFAHLPPGRHTLTLKGSVRSLEAIELNFALPLHQVSTSAEGWEINGLPSPQQSSQILVLKRGQTSLEQVDERLAPTPVAAFVSVHRQVELGLEWTVTTTVERVAPKSGAIHLALPLLEGEAPVSGERHTDGTMDLRLEPTQNTLRFASVLPVTEHLQLQAPTDAPWTEVWKVVTGPMWHTRFEGPPPVTGSGESVWPLWRPRPGESLSLTITRPQPVRGRDLAIDELALTHRPGRKASETELVLRVRSSLGQRLPLDLPPGAELKRVAVNGVERPVPFNDGHLDLPVTPGKQAFTIVWQAPQGATTVTRLPRVDPGEASNINLTLELPGDRWLLATGGPALGPAILFWGVLAVVLLMAIGLARTSLTPLRTWEWLLLSLGVATIHLGVLALTAIWFVALTLRGRLQRQPRAPSFNALQVLLVLLSAVTLVSLAGSVPSSLLSNPDMYVTGNGSSATWLRWYYDRADDLLPGAWALSLPMGIYRMLMLLWSLWLAFALMRWLKWGWQQLHAGAFWVVPPPRTPSSQTPPAADAEQDPADRS